MRQQCAARFHNIMIFLCAASCGECLATVHNRNKLIRSSLKNIPVFRCNLTYWCFMHQILYYCS
ncbi:hypothetical protein UA45_17170 [Morganella morganii]|uniref:Uncharacterized protein n=1 Tax=Morganella morganii TaxID=582 RepID=A0A0D8L4Q1_MORMO|nr:hypothetical protein UA45_17170 [Morganella morganii]